MRTKLYLLTAFLLLAGLASAQHVIGTSASQPSNVVTASLSANRSIIDQGMNITFSIGSASGGIPPYHISYLVWNGTTSTGSEFTGIYSSDYNLNKLIFPNAGSYLVGGKITDNTSVNYTYSAPLSIKVNPSLSVKIIPKFPIALYNTSVLLTANQTGGTSPYSYQWYNGSSCINKIANATGQTYETSNLIKPQGYCVVVNDTYGESARYSVNITIKDSIYTSSGFEYTNRKGGFYTLSPSVVPAQNGSYLIENVTPYANISLSACNSQTFSFFEENLNPSFATLNLNGNTMNIYPENAIPIGLGNCHIELLSIAWAPIIHISNFSIFEGDIVPQVKVNQPNTTTTTITYLVINQTHPITTKTTSTTTSTTSTIFTTRPPTTLTTTVSEANMTSQDTSKTYDDFIFIVIFLIAAFVFLIWLVSRKM